MTAPLALRLKVAGMPPRTIVQTGQEAKRAESALREARAQLRRMDRLVAVVQELGDESANAMVSDLTHNLERLVAHLIGERARKQRLLREAVRNKARL